MNSFCLLSPDYKRDDKENFIHQSYRRRVYSLFNVMPPEPLLAAFFSFCASFFCLLDFGAAFCTFFCSLFATTSTS